MYTEIDSIKEALGRAQADKQAALDEWSRTGFYPRDNGPFEACKALHAELETALRDALRDAHATLQVDISNLDCKLAAIRQLWVDLAEYI